MKKAGVACSFRRVADARASCPPYKPCAAAYEPDRGSICFADSSGCLRVDPLRLRFQPADVLFRTCQNLFQRDARHACSLLVSFADAANDRTMDAA